MASASDRLTAPADDIAAPFRILGPLEVGERNGNVPLGGPRQRAVLAVLLLEPARVVTAETIAAAVWGENTPQSTVGTVRTYVSRLRHLVGPEVLQPRRRGVLLAVDPDAVDAIRFESLVAAARAARDAGDATAASELLTRSLALWRGRVLEDLPELSSHPEVARLEELRLHALEERADAELARGETTSLVAQLDGLVAEHPFRERFCEQLMLALYRSGRQADALAVYARARAVLDEQLGLEPGPRLEELQRRILRHDVDVPGAGREPPTNLPMPVSTFVGRDDELAEVDALLREARLVTLTGIGGGGKTRLALETGHRVRGRHEGGVWLVDLASLEDGATVPGEIARAVGAGATAAPPLEAAAGRVGSRETLLVVDNAEHVLEACRTALLELLAAAPGARALVTSRRSLGIAGEVLYVLPAFVEDAPALFEARARAAEPAIAFDDRAQEDVRAICAMVDSIPLAIELAAARVRALSVGEIRARLAEDGVLGWPGGAIAQRHRSLRNALAWSYELLAPEARHALRRLSVFAGSFTLAAASDVAPPPAGADAFSVVAELVDASLLVVERGSPTRYRLLETVRSYGRELLRSSGEGDDAARAHALHYLALAQRAAAVVFAAEEDVLLTQLDVEYDELRAALAWSLGGGDRGLGLRLARALAWFWPTRGHTLEGRSWLERALALAEDAPDDLRADLVGGLGTIAYRIADFGEAERLLREAAALARHSGSRISEGRWLHNLAGALRATGNTAAAREAADASLLVKRETGDVAGAAWTIGFLADAAQDQGDVSEAERLYEEGVALVRAAGDPPRLLVGYLASRAELALRRDELDRAEELSTESLARARSLGERWHVAVANATLGEVARRRADVPRAEELARAAVREAWEIREMRVVAESLDVLAAAAADRHAADRAATLVGIAAGVRARARATTRAYPAAAKVAAASAQTHVDADRLAQLVAAGEAMSDEDAVASALEAAPRRLPPDR
ncbi:MAG: BTAD domain-containing putative transcriptional regulator [Gaiellaceae bacterium]